jgi:RHS repeat-associated protein
MRLRDKGIDKPQHHPVLNESDTLSSMQTAVKSKPLKRRRSSRLRFLYRIKEIGALLPTKTRAVLLNAATYYPAGPSAGWTFGNGRVMTRTYDKDYRASTIKEAAVGGIDIGLRYDNAGYLTQLTNAALATTPRAKYQYDALGRLLKTSDGSSNAAIETYTYDATGNRTSLALGTAAAQAYTYQSTSHKLTQVGSVGRTYDAMGNLTSVGGVTREYVYNNAGRMSATKQNNATTATYQYNGLGEQVKRTVGATVTVFVYDEGGMLLGQYTGTGTPVQQYVWMDTMPVGVIGSNNTLHYVEADHLGTPRAVIDATRQTAIWQWDLKNEAFGNTAPNADPDADGTAFNLDLRMPGQRYDQASGLYYNYFRDYDPATGRYTQVDPIGLAGGISTFGYVGGNPMGLKDPRGLDWADPLWGMVYQASNGWDGNIDPVFAAVYSATGGWSPDQSTVDFSAGFGDAASFGLTDWIRDRNGTNYQVNKCSGSYLSGTAASVAMTPLGRVAYVAQAARISRIAQTGRQAVAMRNMLRYAYRGPLTRIPFFARWHMRTYLSFVVAGKSEAQIIAGAGRIDKAWTVGLIGVPSVLGAASASNRINECGCN